MLLSSFFTRSMVFAHTLKAQLPFVLFSETLLTIRQNSLNVTVCMIARTFYQGYFIHSLSTLHYCNAPSLATQLTGDYRDRTYTGKCGPASLDTLQEKGSHFDSLLQLPIYFRIFDIEYISSIRYVYTSFFINDVFHSAYLYSLTRFEIF